MESTRVVYWSYRVLKNDHTAFRWELCDPNGRVMARGVAETRREATAHAMAAWLLRFDSQRSPEKNSAGDVDH
jgi:uncharacterized protein YegP (UPF0339 family)